MQSIPHETVGRVRKTLAWTRGPQKLSGPSVVWCLPHDGMMGGEPAYFPPYLGFYFGYDENNEEEKIKAFMQSSRTAKKHKEERVLVGTFGSTSNVDRDQ